MIWDMKHAPTGLVATGTTARELVPAFARTLCALAPSLNAASRLAAEVDAALDAHGRCLAAFGESYLDDALGALHVETLAELLSALSPPGYYFGALDGDVHGYWRLDDDGHDDSAFDRATDR